MSLVSRYKLNDLATLGVDDTGNGHDLVNLNNTGVTTDATYGTVVHFNGVDIALQRSVSPLTGDVPYTLSFWAKLDLGITSTSFWFSQSNTAFIQHILSQNRVNYTAPGANANHNFIAQEEVSQWNNYTIAYNGSSTRLYRQGALSSGSTGTSELPVGVFHIGNLSFVPNVQGFQGQMLDFRIYDYAFSSAEIAEHFNAGPNPVVAIFSTTLITPSGFKVTWEAIPGATNYEIGVSSGQDGENTIEIEASGGSLLRYRHISSPGSIHTAYLYSDGVLQGSETITVSTDVADYSKVFFESFDEVGVFDLEGVDNTVFFINDVFDDGDKLKITLPSGKKLTTTFVSRGGSSSITNGPIVVPFSTDSGSGQTISMTLSDSTNVSVSYDETTEDLTIESGTYSIGDSLVLDGKKVTIVDI